MASSTSFTEGGQGGGGDVNDPFYLVREEISDSVSTCESSFSRMHNLQTNQQQKKETCINISSEIDSLLWQLNELDRATEAAEIRWMGVGYSSHVMTTMVPILTEIYRRGSLTLFMIYFPYFFVPLLLFYSLATSREGHVFERNRRSATAKRK